MSKGKEHLFLCHGYRKEALQLFHRQLILIIDLRYEHEDSVHGLEVGEVGVGDAVLPPVEEVDHGARARVYSLRHAEHRHEAEDPLAAALRPPLEDRLETHHSQLRKVFATI